MACRESYATTGRPYSKCNTREKGPPSSKSLQPLEFNSKKLQHRYVLQIQRQARTARYRGAVTTTPGLSQRLRYGGWPPIAAAPQPPR